MVELKSLIEARATVRDRRIELETSPYAPPSSSASGEESPIDELQRDDLEEDVRRLKREEDQLGKSIRELEKRLKRLDSVLASEFVKLSAEQLQHEISVYLPSTGPASMARRLVELHADWATRFGRTPEFGAALLMASQVVAGTCIGIMGVKGADSVEYDLCIIDEASKATPTETLVPLSRARRCVIVGDTRQLSPFQEPAFKAAALAGRFSLTEDDLKTSLFDHLIEQVPEQCRIALTTHGRTLIQQGGSRLTAGAATARLMSGLVVAEVALALALVAGAGWLVQSYDRLRAIDRGFVSEGRIVVDVRPALPSRDAATVDPWVEHMLSEVRAAVPDATVGSAWTYPLRTDNDGTTNVQVESDEASSDRPQTSHARAVSAGLLEAMGVRLVAGRLFTADDRRDSERVVIVTRTFVTQVLGGRDPLSTRIGFGYPQPNMAQLARIVGVVDDVRYESPTSAPEPMYYVPLTQVFPMQRQSIVVASAHTPPAVLIERVRSALARVDPTLIVEAAPATRFVDAATREQHLGRMMMLGFGVAALLLAAVGIYGVIAYIASMRRRELATRVALSATSAQILWLMLGSARRSALLGGFVGLLLAYAGGHILASRVVGVSPGDAGVLAGAWVAVSAVALAAAAVPALRASRADPLRALRAD